MAKKRTDGYFKKTFTVEGKKYYVYGKNTKELFEKEKKKREEIERGFEKRENPTVTEFYNVWAKSRRNKVSEATLRTQAKEYNVISAIMIESANRTFGELKIRDVSLQDLETVQGELLKSRKSRTVNDYMSFIKHIFSDAVKRDILIKNPCVGLENLKITEERARDTHHRALSIEEQKRFFECERCKNSYYYNVFRIAVSTGMRIGEIGALRYSDIRNGIIHVERTITRAEAGNYVIGENAKTEAGRRIIPMNEQIKAIVSDQKNFNAMIDGNVYSMNDLLFKAVERGLLMATPIDREIKRICKECGVQPFTMHAFRDTFATRAIESGMNPKTLQEILGHSNFNITMSLYGHCMTDTKKQEMDNINIAI